VRRSAPCWHDVASAGSGPRGGSPAPIRRAAEKSARDSLIRLAQAHPVWALGFADEVWWSRVAVPVVRTWTATGQPLRLVEQAVANGEQWALACYRALMRWWPAPDDTPAEAMWVRFVDGRPLSGVTTQFLAWCYAKLAEGGKRALLVWDNASWHLSQPPRAWIAAHNRAARCEGGAYHRLPLADEESLAQPDRAKVDARQEASDRTCPPAARRRIGRMRR